MKTSKEQKEIFGIGLPLISFFVAFVGVALSMWGASWDITSHLLRSPETFFTPSHGVLYTGVGISLISAIMNLVLLRKKITRKRSFAFGSKLIVVGALMQIIAGPGDFYWHELFGIDGLMSPTHITLALGILITSLGSMIGLARVRPYLAQKEKFANIILTVSFGVFWFSVMWLVFFFVLPISEGETHNFNPDKYLAVTLSFVALPFAYSVVFWSASASLNKFGAASMVALSFIVMNVTSNILTSEKLLLYLPLFAIPIVTAIIADYVLNKAKSTLIKKHREKISGSILGSSFFIFSFPMLAMTFLEFYIFNDVFSYDVLHTASETISQVWAITIIPGAISGMLGMMFASRKLNRLSNAVESDIK